VEAEPARELGDTRLALGITERQKQSRRPIDRADRIPVEDHRSVSLFCR
jgi:hypothetical protein